MADPTNPFASWLSTMGAALGYTNDARLAKALGVNQSIVNRWRRGSQPSVAHLWTVSRLFRTDLVALLVLTGHIPSLPEESVSAPEVSPSDEALAAAHRRIVELEAELDRMRTGVGVVRDYLGDLVGANGTDARRAEQAKVVIERHRKLRATLPARTDDPGVGAELLEEMAALAPLRARVNAEHLD